MGPCRREQSRACLPPPRLKKDEEALKAERLAELVEEGPARRRSNELGQADSLFLGEGDRSIGRLARPDAEAELRRPRFTREIVRDAEGAPGVPRHIGMRREELDELAALGHSAPGAEAEPVLDAVPTVAARMHPTIVC